MANLVPINPDLSAQAFNITLADQTFKFHFYYVDRMSSWYMHIDSINGTRLISGVRVTTFWPLGFIAANATFPQGLLLTVDLERTLEDPTRDGLGVRWMIMFVEPNSSEATLITGG